MRSLPSRGPGRPPASNAADTRARIVRAGRAVFSEVGYDAATFQAIADRADLTRPAINHYFSGKAELYREVLRQTNEIFIEWSASRSQNEVTLAGKIRAYISSGLESLEEERSAAAFLITSVVEAQRHPELVDPRNDPNQGTLAFVVSAINAAIESGDVSGDIDVESVADMLVALLWGMTIYGGFVGDQERLEQISERFLELLSGHPWRRSQDAADSLGDVQHATA